MFIQGPAGDIEAEWDKVPKATGTAVLCHPHPQFGGSMHDGVLQIASETLGQRGFNCLRFNFRGVGGSSGTYDGGEGECQDLLAVLASLKASGADDAPWLLGYSFGASVVWRALSQINSEQISNAILVAPPVGRMSFPAIPTLPCPVFAIAGDQDEFVDQQALTHLAGVKTRIIEGADHFFGGSAEKLVEAIEGVLLT